MPQYKKNKTGDYTYNDPFKRFWDWGKDLVGSDYLGNPYGDIDDASTQNKIDKEFASSSWNEYLRNNPTDLVNAFNRNQDWRIDLKDSRAFNENTGMYEQVNYGGIENIFNNKVTDSPAGALLNPPSFGDISSFNNMTLGGAYAALSANQVLQWDKGINDYNQKQATDPLTQTNLDPYLTKPDSGFINPLAAEAGALVGKQAIQAEEGEVIVLPDYRIVDVAATEKHKDMDDDEVTEHQLPEGSFIGSNSDKDNLMLHKKDFEDKEGDIIFSTIEDLKENKKPDLPKETKLSEIIFKDKEKKITVAEALERIRDYAPISERENSPIDATTDAANLALRGALIPKILSHALPEMLKAELKESKKTKDNSDKPKKAFAGTAIALGISTLLSGIQYMNNKKNVDKNRKLVEDAFLKRDELLNLGTNIGLGSALLKNSEVAPRKFRDLMSELTDEQGKGTPFALKEYYNDKISGNLNMGIKGVQDMTPSFGKASALVDNMYSTAQQQTSDTNAKIMESDIATKNTANAAKINLLDKFSQEDYGDEMLRRGLVDNKIGAISDVGTNYTNQKSFLTGEKAGIDVTFNNQANKSKNEFLGSLGKNAMSFGTLLDSEASKALNLVAPSSGGTPNLFGTNAMNTDATSKMTFNNGIVPPTAPKWTTPYSMEDASLLSKTDPSYLSKSPIYNISELQGYANSSDPNYNLVAPSNPQLSINTPYDLTESKAPRLNFIQETIGYPLDTAEIDAALQSTTDPNLQKALTLAKYYIEDPSQLNAYTKDELISALQLLKDYNQGYDSGSFNLGTLIQGNANYSDYLNGLIPINKTNNIRRNREDITKKIR